MEDHVFQKVRGFQEVEGVGCQGTKENSWRLEGRRRVDLPLSSDRGRDKRLHLIRPGGLGVSMGAAGVLRVRVRGQPN